MCLSFCKFSAALYAECMKCVPNDTNITSTGHSRNHRHTHPQRISHRICANLTGRLWRAGRGGGSDPWTPSGQLRPGIQS